MGLPRHLVQGDGMAGSSSVRSWGPSAPRGPAVVPEIVAALVGRDTACMLEAMQVAAEVRSKALAVRDIMVELQERLIELVDARETTVGSSAGL